MKEGEAHLAITPQRTLPVALTVVLCYLLLSQSIASLLHGAERESG